MDRDAAAVDPDHRFGQCLAECLTRAVPPSAWHEVEAPGDRGDRRDDR